MEWVLTDDHEETGIIEADNLVSALEAAREWVAAAGYDIYDYGDGGTIYVHVQVACEESGEDGEVTVALNPYEPPCDGAAEHQWTSPNWGLAENPGVVGHGGGVIVEEICSTCGLHRHTDTWAQDTETGEQGFTSITYTRGDR